MDLNLKFNTSDLDKDVTTEIPEEEHNEIDDENQSGTAIDEGNIGIIKIFWCTTIAVSLLMRNWSIIFYRIGFI